MGSKLPKFLVRILVSGVVIRKLLGARRGDADAKNMSCKDPARSFEGMGRSGLPEGEEEDVYVLVGAMQPWGRLSSCGG